MDGRTKAGFDETRQEVVHRLSGQPDRMIDLLSLAQSCKPIDPDAKPPSRAMPIHDQIVERLTAHLFSGPLIQNDYRGDYVEELVALALAPDWTLCSEAWAGWDLQHRGGLRMQVKQSAARQSWEGKPYVGSFGIAPATGYWIDGTQWVEQVGQPADLYVFAWHPRANDTCDHRDPSQWLFFVAKERGLRRDKLRI